MNAPLFHEQQRFRQSWMWLLVGLLVVLQWWGFVEQILLGRPWGNRPAPDWMMVGLWVIFGIGMPWFMHYLRLTVTVTNDDVTVRFRPLTTCVIPVTDIESVEARTYSSLREFGGWGIRGIGAKKAYNVGGDRGAELTLNDGRTVLLGSGRADELAKAIETACSSRAVR